MIPINQLNCFLHYRKFSLILTLAVTAFTQISPAQATFREDANTLKTLKLSNVKSESVSTDALSQNKKPLKKELSDNSNLINDSDSEELFDNLQQANLIKRLKASKRIAPSTKNYFSEFTKQAQTTIPDSQNISEPEFLTTDNLIDINRENSLIIPTDNKLLQAQNTSEQDVEKIINQLDAVKDIEIPSFFYSPGFSIYVPTGFGGDRNTGFVSASYQERGRFSNDDDLGLGVGVGLGDSQKSVGVELSYTLASFGRNRDFGSGGFNVKVHRQLPGDWGVAVGWNGFLNIGDENNFEQSLYGVATKIIRTQEKLDSPFSRVAVTLGVGGGQFRTEEAVFDGDDEIGVFGSVAVRAVKSASIIAEWTGQDLGVGVSVAPFPNIPLVITPALRDITGAGDGTRFVIGTGFSFKF
ncbi:MAG: hypothetical protein HC836_12860 [Richelia sp. RM2_1_2]|nr:hypothetical protein [Richelia sp. SM1_7_0]NJO59182.1 hypothetical protein [Richelia sp. RM2_1_2]